jgi:hypothetical protein
MFCVYLNVYAVVVSPAYKVFGFHYTGVGFGLLWSEGENLKAVSGMSGAT